LELCISCWEALLVIGAIVPLFLRLELKKEKLLQSLEKILCCGIKDWGILERRAFKYYMVKVWLKVCPILSLDFDFYEHHLYGKKNHVIFSSSAMRVEGILQLVHNDVFGPMSVPSLGKYMYYVSFIDDFLRNTWIYFLGKKYEVFEKFKEFKALVENQTKKRIKVLRTDNGGELRGNEFEEFCKKCGIERNKNTPYTPQVKWSCRKDEHDVDGKSKEHAQWCWVRTRNSRQEAVGTACYLVNRSPSSALDEKTPGLKGYKLWNPENKKVVYSRDVVFIEIKDVVKHDV
jgi:hypothetical protein